MGQRQPDGTVDGIRCVPGELHSGDEFARCVAFTFSQPPQADRTLVVGEAAAHEIGALLRGGAVGRAVTSAAMLGHAEFVERQRRLQEVSERMLSPVTRQNIAEFAERSLVVSSTAEAASEGVVFSTILRGGSTVHLVLPHEAIPVLLSWLAEYLPDGRGSTAI